MRKTCISLLFDVPYIKSFALCWCMYPSRLRTGCKSSSHFHVNSGCWYSMCCSSLISDAFSKLMQLNKFIFLNWTSVNVTNLCSLKRAPCIDVHIHCLWSPCSPQSQLVEHNWHLFSPVAGSQFGSSSICLAHLFYPPSQPASPHSSLPPPISSPQHPPLPPPPQDSCCMSLGTRSSCICIDGV